MFCPSCGKQLGDLSAFCPHCGAGIARAFTPPPPLPPPPRKPPVTRASVGSSSPKIKSSLSGQRTIVWIAAGFVLFFVAVALAANWDRMMDHMPSAKPPVVQTFDTGNVANDKLLALPEERQAITLGIMADPGCYGTRAFYMGISKRNHAAFWSVSCRSGGSYQLIIDADNVGTTRATDCSLIRAVTEINCFEKLRDFAAIP